MEKYSAQCEKQGMELNRRVLFTGEDSWEGEMTCQGRTFKVEATLRTRKGSPEWDVEVLKRTGRWTFQPLYLGAYPTLDAALQAAERGIQGLVTDDPDADAI